MTTGACALILCSSTYPNFHNFPVDPSELRVYNITRLVFLPFLTFIPPWPGTLENATRNDNGFVWFDPDLEDIV